MNNILSCCNDFTLEYIYTLKNIQYIYIVMNEGTCVGKYTYIAVGVPVYSKLKCEYYSIYAGYYTNAKLLLKCQLPV